MSLDCDCGACCEECGHYDDCISLTNEKAEGG